nr:immunoglobulin heavy chain junction region [Macaca mulatta]MOW19786.1 immunoglobulin heavy chain junction region [Macaca mulatta]MOW20228.1 immunoglobulin heavy chain junction region [Macaca mulatta]MOW21639.1 immunoglobulin heavy chain junction region [Macaca mulatta]
CANIVFTPPPHYYVFYSW